MADLNDIKGYQDRLRNGLQLLQDSTDVTEDERRLIREFIEHQDSQGLGVGTNASNLSRLRLFAERSTMCMTEMEKSDVDSMLFTYKHSDEYGFSDGTLREDRKALRKFYRWLDRGWSDEIKVGSKPDRSVDEKQVFTEEESTRLLDACRNSRDKGLAAFLLDTAVRIGAAGTLRVSDVDLTERAGKFSLNEDAVGLKGASGTRPLTWSRGYIANWLDVHPRSHDDDAPLWHKLQGPVDRDLGPEAYGRSDIEDDGALSYNQIQSRLKDAAERAGIDRSRANPHNFRHTAITRWIREGLSEQEIKHRAYWVEDSDQFEIYNHVTEAEMNEQILDRYGLGGEREEVGVELNECVQCGAALRQDRPRFCPGCGAPLTYGAASDLESMEDVVVGDIAEYPELAKELMVVREVLRERPELREPVSEVLD